MPSIFGKRKLSRDDDDHCDYAPTKQVKLASSATRAHPDDVAMSDTQNFIPFPSFTSFPNSSSSGLSINTNSSPNYSISSLPSASPVNAYPAFDLYPEVETPMDVDMDATATATQPLFTSTDIADYRPGLLQPSTSTALRHGGNCTQIPRLRMSSHAGLHGTRTLWSHCESCGAIEMVKA
ncbi:hypothetical protein FRB99_001663 [Tulasnella sp. 403]|nr:hypothetical protein FRB99_001663 [Tulasnella sp. 403]